MKKILVAFALGAVISVGQAGVAHAADVSVTANINAGGIGLRSLTSTPAIVLDPSLGVGTVEGLVTAVVTETAVTGTNPWSVSATMTALSLSGQPDIANSNLAISGRSTIQVAGGGTKSNPVGSENMSASRTLHTQSDQLTSSIYTGLYTTTGDLDLTVPNGTVAGIYTGTMTITLNQ